MHGFVQGVGYRAYVKGIADRLGVVGTVKNQDDGSVLIEASAGAKEMNEFEGRINISMKNGIQVHHIEKRYEGGEGTAEELGFRIIR